MISNLKDLRFQLLKRQLHQSRDAWDVDESMTGFRAGRVNSPRISKDLQIWKTHTGLAENPASKFHGNIMCVFGVILQTKKSLSVKDQRCVISINFPEIRYD